MGLRGIFEEIFVGALVGVVFVALDAASAVAGVGAVASDMKDAYKIL